MSFVVLTTDQRSDEWRKARAGRLCASRAADMLATIKKGEAAARRDLRVQLVVERLTGEPQEEGFVSKDMQRGTDKEPDAFAAYEALTGQIVQKCGFLGHPELMAGCSPDGVIGTFRGLLELKCPKSATHLSYLRAGVVPSDYLPQIIHQLWITGAEWCDFGSFDDRFPPPLRLFIVRVHREQVDLKAYELAARMFLTEVEREVEEVSRLAAVA